MIAIEQTAAVAERATQWMHRKTCIFIEPDRLRMFLLERPFQCITRYSRTLREQVSAGRAGLRRRALGLRWRGREGGDRPVLVHGRAAAPAPAAHRPCGEDGRPEQQQSVYRGCRRHFYTQHSVCKKSDIFLLHTLCCVGRVCRNLAFPFTHSVLCVKVPSTP